MHDKEIKAMARALCCCQGMCCVADKNPAACKCHMYQHDAIAALSALLAARPDAAAVLSGEAVAVPREATDEMLDAHWAQTGESREMRHRTHALMRRHYRAMLAASPYTNG